MLASLSTQDFALVRLIALDARTQKMESLRQTMTSRATGYKTEGAVEGDEKSLFRSRVESLSDASSSAMAGILWRSKTKVVLFISFSLSKQKCPTNKKYCS
jgi:hypothetical protein